MSTTPHLEPRFAEAGRCGDRDQCKPGSGTENDLLRDLIHQDGGVDLRERLADMPANAACTKDAAKEPSRGRQVVDQHGGELRCLAEDPGWSEAG